MCYVFDLPAWRNKQRCLKRLYLLPCWKGWFQWQLHTMRFDGESDFTESWRKLLHIMFSGISTYG